ncbi:hypothetical protein [Cylindrospermum sp. FACHB-282]|uniref:hypothetical protein n=1 Tax=Cylindrospermum sp. FACHB-282 TaxID=2692794 RepID=UPI001688ECA1|nr:hypothetical protein [Cylindrospermum sp. FACHB-282]MBD2388875.1 hypothetical protein [Cylindrospermum sp. FACHB-282]
MIDTERLAKLAYESKYTEEGDAAWKDAPSYTQEGYMAIANAQKAFVEGEIERQVHEASKRISSYAIHRLIKAIQPSMTHRERLAFMVELMLDLSEAFVDTSGEVPF